MFAYILISFDPGKERTGFETISKMEEVKRINIIYGEWDIIILIETEGPGALENFIIDKIRVIDGVKLTSTMIVAR